MANRSGRQRYTGRPAPSRGARGVRSFTLLLLVMVVGGVAITMVGTFFGFVFAPDPGVKAGPMYVTLALTTGAVFLMFLLALNASFLPFISAQRARDVRLVTWTMAGTGLATGILTMGTAVQSIVTRMFIAGLAFAFIRIQEVRIERARRAVDAGPAAPPQGRPHPKGRQKRGGRNR